MSGKKMRAVEIEEYGGPEVLKLVEATIPQPGEGQVLIRVHAAGVNPADWKMRAGYMKQFRPIPMPWSPGLDGAGVVEAVGPGVTQFRQGQPVYGTFQGAYAEFAVAQASDLQPKPDRLSFDEAAAVPVGALTAWNCVVDVANVQPGQRVLVQGAAGGVGLFAVQFAGWKGAQVVGTASPANMDFVRSLGAEPVDYTAGPVEQKVKDVDAVIDTVGGEVLKHSPQLIRPGGILVTIAGMIDENAAKDLGIRAARGGRAAVERLGDISQLIEKGIVRPVVYRVFPLAEAAQAQALSQTGHGRGRIVLHIAD